MSEGSSFDIGRFLRTLVLIVGVTAVFLLLAATRLEGYVFPNSALAIGVVALFTAMVAFLIAAASSVGH